MEKSRLSLYDEIKLLMENQEELQLLESDLWYEIVGKYKFNIINRNKSYIGKTSIRIVVSKNFPDTLPVVYFHEVPNNMEHVYQDKSVCLASIGELVFTLSKNKSFIDFFKKFIDSFIYTMKWFEEYDTYVFGERDHGIIGLLDYYKECHGIDFLSYKKMCTLVENGVYRGHQKCFCGSEKKIRDCHGVIIIPIINNNSLRAELLREQAYIERHIKSIYKMKVTAEINNLKTRKGRYI